MSITKIYSLFIGLFIMFIPLIVMSGIANRYEYPRFLLFVSMAFLCMILTGIHASTHPVRFKELSSPFVLLSLVYLLWVLCTDFWGLDTKISLMGSPLRLQGYVTTLSGFCIAFSLIYFCRVAAKTTRGVVITSLMLSAVIVSTVGLIHLLLIHSSYPVLTFQGRLLSTFGNPNFLAGYLAVLFPIILYINQKKYRHENLVIHILLWILVLVMTLNILFSGSRSGILALVSIIGLYAFMVSKKLVIRVGLGVLFLLCIGIGISIYTTHLNRFSAWDNRGLIWQTGVNAASQKPFIGYGQENFELIVPAHLHYRVDTAHNIFLEVLVASGVIGLGFFLCIIIFGMQQASPAIRLGLLAFLISASFNPVSIAQLALFYLLLGVGKEK